jgi:hypothetical protein
MFQAIAKSALDLDVLGSVRVLFRFRQPVDLVDASIYVKGLLLLVSQLETICSRTTSISLKFLLVTSSQVMVTWEIIHFCSAGFS